MHSSDINTVQDLLYYLPRTYEDRANIKTLNQFQLDNSVQSFKICVVDKKFIPQWYKKRYEVNMVDALWNTATAIYLNTNFARSALIKNERYILIAKPLYRKWLLTFWYPEFIKSQVDSGTAIDAISTSNTSDTIYQSWRIYPIYTELGGIKSDRFAKKIRWLQSYIPQVMIETLPQYILHKYNLLDLQTTVARFHYPETLHQLKSCRYRLYFERLLRMQLLSQLNKSEYLSHHSYSAPTIPDWEIIKEIIWHLSFTLTLAQKKVIKQVIDNIHSGKPMMRLLQWDVGSGKTIIWAIAAWYMIKKFWSQIAFVAPIEVLAQQHARSLATLFLPLGIHISCLTWSVKPKEKEKIKFDLKQGRIHIIVGTHALLQETVSFAKLGLVIIDEQHKFGVNQRSFFKQFGSPHILQMTATPIPRSLAMAYFWEFDVSIIDEMPAWRLPIQTKIVTESQRNKLKPRIMTKISQNQRMFVITPLITDSEHLDEVKSALTEYEWIKQTYPELEGEIWLLHGKVKSIEKDRIMADFKSGRIKILISTTVIEVGIDIPQASIIVIKNSERFGLSQLHQLRGRVGRSDIQSYCFLETSTKWTESYDRLKHMENTYDGFKLAEIDMKLRGPGEILGLRQSGETDVPLELLCDSKVIAKVQSAASDLLEHHPGLENLDELKKQMKYTPWTMLI